MCTHTHTHCLINMVVMVMFHISSPDYTMVSFVKPNLLGTQKEFTNRFVNPIVNGQCRDSTSQDVRRMKQRAHVLHDMLKASVQVRVEEP